MFNCLERINITAIRSKSGALTYGQLNEKIDETARTLETCGLTAGTLLGLYIPSGIHFILYFFAALRIGASVCPLNLRIPPKIALEKAKDLGAKMFIGDQIHHFPGKSLPSQSIYLFTSGSTDEPKPIRHTLASLLANARGAIDAVELKERDSWLLSLPLFHVGGIGILLRCLLSGAEVALDPFDLRITHASYVPTQLYRAWPIYPKLKSLLLGGAPIRETPEQLPLIPTYGLTEMGSAVLATRKYAWKNGQLFLGQPLREREMKIVGGEIYVRGDCLYPDCNDWYPTGDLGIYDKEKGFAIVGRKDNLFFSGGENVQPEEIERELMLHPHIMESYVIPKPDPEFGARPVVFVKSLQPIGLKEVRRFLSEKLPKYKIPTAVYPLEDLIESPMKINRKKLFEKLTS